ncbi:MAG: hypothetical protein HXX17_13915 [Geobacteraceae bacterium]|nr:hypothetical protein [Geobacteraceae bacterium]
MKPFIFTAMAMALALLSGCSSTSKYGHGDIVVGKVAIFRHKSSKMYKLECTECHDKLFITVKIHEKHDMEQLMAGDSCGTCHNGNRAFSVHGNCKACHRKNA